jgi:cell wall-associated NlpC family hydrolase
LQVKITKEHPVVKKFLLTVILAALLTFCLQYNILAASPIAVTYDGKPIAFDVQPVLDNGRVLVPLRAIFETLGADVDWNGSTRTATAIRGLNTISLTVGETTAYINTTAVQLDVPAQTVDGRILVPLRFVSEAMGADVVWNSADQTVEISRKAEETISALKVEYVPGERQSTLLIQGLVLVDSEGDTLYETRRLSSTKFLIRFDSSLGDVKAEQLGINDALVKKISVSKDNITNKTTVVIESAVRLYFMQDNAYDTTDFVMLMSTDTTFSFSTEYVMGGNGEGPETVAGVSTMGDEAAALAQNYLGTRYVWGGMTPDGFDCSGFVFYIYKQFGITLPRVSCDQAANGTPVARNDLMPGDLVFFFTDSSRPQTVSHSGMYIGGGKFIHSSSSKNGVIISSLDSSYYTAAYQGARRYWY